MIGSVLDRRQAILGLIQLDRDCNRPAMTTAQIKHKLAGLGIKVRITTIPADIKALGYMRHQRKNENWYWVKR